MGSSPSVPVVAGTVPVSVIDKHKLRLKVKIVDDKGQSQSYLMLLSVEDPSIITQDFILRSAERLYADRAGITTSLTELVTEDNFQFPAGEPLVEYLRDNDKLIARAPKSRAAPSAQAPAAVSVASSSAPSFFCSYCWKNSSDAEAEKEIQEAVGTADPRAIQASLKSEGLLGWLDKEQLGKAGLFDQLSGALLATRAVVAFISDEYAKSDNCNMELLYAAKTLHLPIIPVVVGSGMDWLRSQIGLVLAGQLWIDLRDPEKFEDGLQALKSRLKAIVGDDVDDAAYKQIANVAEPDDPEVDDGFEVLCDPALVGNLSFDREFSQEITYYQKTGKPTEGGPASLYCKYWWPVTVIEVQGDRVKVKYASYEDWPEDQSWFDKTALRCVQYGSTKIDPSTLVGKKVEAKLHQNKSYCWVEGVVKTLLPDNQCLVEFTDATTDLSEAAITQVLSGRAEGTTLDDVLINAVECKLGQLRLL